jgi:hypothetical protein
LDTCCSAALVDDDDISRGDSRGLLLGAGHTPGCAGPGGGNIRRGTRRRRNELLHNAPPARPAYDPKGGGRRAGVGCRSLACTGVL